MKFLPRPLLLLACATACHAPPPEPLAPDPASASETDIVLGQTLTLHSAVLGEERTVNVCLPWRYQERTEHFPVVYLVDGGVEQDFIPVAGFGALATLSGQYREFILVGVQTNRRQYELTTPSEMAQDVELLPENGGAALFRRFVLEEVRPLIRERYRTSGESAVLGESLAGLFIVDTFLKAPQSFDHYIAVSPSLWWQEQALARSAAEHLAAEDFPEGRSLYLSVADEVDIQAGVTRMIAALKEQAPGGLTWWYDPMPTEHHHTIYHPATLNALRLVFGAE